VIIRDSAPARRPSKSSPGTPSRRPDASKPDTDAKTDKGGGEYKVKGKRATAKQRDVIEGVLSQASDDNASTRVMVACIMCITQESVAGEQVQMTGNDDTGIFQQGRNWVSEEDSKDPEKSCHAFLVTGPTSWKKVHGGLKKAPGNLSHAIHEVQHNADANAYAQWENEAKDTVAAWDGGGGGGGSYAKRYEFTRGDRQGSRENSWDAMARLVGEVGAYRWAAFNTLYAASGDELRAQRASLLIRGDEPWLAEAPSWSWANNRAISEVSLQVLADRWDVTPGGCVVMHDRFGVMAGRYIVWNVSGESLDSPVTTVVLRRPTRLKSEPPTTTSERSQSGSSSDLKDICQNISDKRSAYVYGGSHGPKLSSLEPSSHFDCSSSCSYALHKADMFNGDVAITSGAFASSWGKPGAGDEFTIMANSEHVWIEFEDGSRFDTSQHGGKSGPAYTEKKRSDQGRFTKKHWPGH